jgi:predicted nucleic acid-binding protein
VTYWDTSALLKLYVPEPDSAALLELVSLENQPIYSSAITTVEVLCAVHRKERSGDLKPASGVSILRKFRADCGAGRIVLIPYGDDVAARAEQVVRLALQRSRPGMIRSLDAIHIASALKVGAKKMIATDMRLREVASLARFKLAP